MSQDNGTPIPFEKVKEWIGELYLEKKALQESLIRLSNQLKERMDSERPETDKS